LTYMPKLSLSQIPVNANAQGGGKEDKKPRQVTVDSGERRREFLHQVRPSVTIIAPFKQTMKAAV